MKNKNKQDNENCLLDLPVIQSKKCGTCGKSFGIYVPLREEMITYKTISGKVKVVYWCLSCQLSYYNYLDVPPAV